jgi:putative membrane protein
MSERRFLEASAKARTADTIRGVERETAVEVVVTVRHRAARHLLTSLGFGVGCAALGFLVMWFGPREYDVRTIPLDVGISLVLGVAVCAAVPGLRRLLTPRKSLRARAEQAAHAAFKALGIEKTRSRTGLLVYVALFERTAVLVPDSGLAQAALAGPLAGVAEQLAGAVGRLDLEGFLAALAGLGPTCALSLPRRADDENELCDDVV